MGLFRKRAPATGDRQVSTEGSVAAPDPLAHLATNAPPVGGNDFPSADEDAGSIPRGRGRSWRAPQVYRQGDVPGVETDAGALARGVHTGLGTPTARGQWGGSAGYPVIADDRMRSGGETQAQDAAGVETITPAVAPVQTRAGSVGTDPTRPSKVSRWTFWRPFDAWAQYGPQGVSKVPLAPSAALPLSYDGDVKGGKPGPGGTGDTKTIGYVLKTVPNSVRVIPNPWDQQYLQDGTVPGVQGDAAMAGVRTQRAGGWRAR